MIKVNLLRGPLPRDSEGFYFPIYFNNDRGLVWLEVRNGPISYYSLKKVKTVIHYKVN